ncbi:MAG: hypothetical protein OHK0039_19170 [Bacteroidia bacterium]
MEAHVKQLLTRLSSKELVRLCNEKMICAARDLAEFTKNGINAGFIVSLAHKCELYEDAIQQPQAADNQHHQFQYEIQDAVERICETGKAIWSHDPAKYQDYVLAHMDQTQNNYRASRP